MTDCATKHSKRECAWSAHQLEQNLMPCERSSCFLFRRPTAWALAAVGAGVEWLVKRDKPKATKKVEKRAAHPPSAARCVGRRHGTPTILLENDYQTHSNGINE